jgi:hypothetical protein
LGFPPSIPLFGGSAQAPAVHVESPAAWFAVGGRGLGNGHVPVLVRGDGIPGRGVHP